ncbi:MAG: hybrid sensor histidine kinase/response regulator [Nitrospirae bacterium]|nr:hybrid sensor histidine kinase/response regulator [Nitrospirota bacterium]
MNMGKYGSVLVVDDEPTVLEASSLLLKEYGYNVTSSPGAEDAVRRFQENSVDVVVTDIVMPSVSGIDLLRQIHDINPTTPVILMTAYADMEKVLGAIKIGAFDFIIKPFTAELFVHSVEKAVHYNKLMLMEKDYKHLLEEYNQEIETLVAERTMGLMSLTLADKIRNPAAVIGLTCRRMLEKNEVPELLIPKINGIVKEAEKLDDIVKEFQSLLKNKKSMFRYEDVNEVVDSIMPIIENMVTSKKVEVSYKRSDSPLKVNIQKNLFQIALSHLVKNSVDAINEGGKISISTRESDNICIIEVSDTGRGISPEDIDKIFNPLFSSKDKRFGMGLPLVKRIVTEHMGEIDVESRPGEGATFRIKLPLRWSQNI